uniref:Defective in cullin neddylation protein n=1 Tax=Trypanosoma congolense (strain IL3000) TaxID=1068625 RepID=G0UX94_TRYCI|nr:conserved hypothetical protein [Trypanosoma congolense IL3000]
MLSDPPRQHAQLGELFDIIAGKLEGPTHPVVDILSLAHLDTLAKALGLSLNDTSMYRLAWTWGCETPLSISRNEFLNGMSKVLSEVGSSPKGVGSVASDLKSPMLRFKPWLEKLRNHIDNIDSVLRTDRKMFRKFYRFIFKWVQSPETMTRNGSELGMNIKTAVELWHMLFPSYWPFEHLEQWVTFCTTEKLFAREVISRDLWEQLLEFTQITDYSAYNVCDAWPSAIDDFVEHVRSKG